MMITNGRVQGMVNTHNAGGCCGWLVRAHHELGADGEQPHGAAHDDIGLHVVHYCVVPTLVPRGTVLVHRSDESQDIHNVTNRKSYTAFIQASAAGFLPRGAM